MINPAFNIDRNMATNLNETQAAELIVSQMFTRILNSMHDNPLTEDDLLIPKSNTEKWFQEMINAEYAQQIASKELKPLVDVVKNSYFGAVR